MSKTCYIMTSYLEAHLDEVSSFERGVCTRHGDDLGLLDQQVPRSVGAAPQQLEGAELLQT